MKKLIGSMLLLLMIILFVTPQLQAEVKNKPLLGEWKYEVSDAPYGYEKGSLIFSEKDGNTICVIKVEAGELPASNLKIEKNKITFSTMVEGETVNVELIREKNKLSGKVDSPEGPKTMTAQKK
jgi:hypothetical protein